MRESAFTKKVMKELKAIGASVEKVSDRFASGRSDLSICFKGISIRLESKASEDSEYTQAQCLYLIQHVKAGGIGMFIHPGNWDYVFEFIKGLEGVNACSSYRQIVHYGTVQVEALSQKKELKNPTKSFDTPSRGNNNTRRNLVCIKG